MGIDTPTLDKITDMIADEIDMQADRLNGVSP